MVLGILSNYDDCCIFEFDLDTVTMVAQGEYTRTGLIWAASLSSEALGSQPFDR
jgi:hypothetical protein